MNVLNTAVLSQALSGSGKLDSQLYTLKPRGMDSFPEHVFCALLSILYHV